MARKKARTKRTAGKKNPLAAMKSKLAKIAADIKAIKAKTTEAAKRVAAMEKAAGGAAAAAPKAAKKKAGRKKRRGGRKAKAK
jgi:hypothetical protein